MLLVREAQILEQFQQELHYHLKSSLQKVESGLELLRRKIVYFVICPLESSESKQNKK